MQVLEAYPFALLSGLFNSFDGNFVATTAHSDLMEGSPANYLLSIRLQLLRGVGAWRDNEEDWLGGCGFLLVKSWQTEWSWLDCLTIESLLYKLIHS